MRRAPTAFAQLAALAALAAGCGGSSKPRPDLLLVSTRDGDYAIYAMNADGARQKRLTDNAGANEGTQTWLFFQLDPAWSPDGKRIAFASKRQGTFDLYAMNVDGTGTRRLTRAKGDDVHPSWAADGSLIAFSRDETDIYVVRPDGSGLRRLTGIQASESQPAWSPDGGSIAYVRREPGSSVRELWLMRADGSGPRQLTSLRASSLFPAWSPDGRRIAFASNVAGRYYDIYSLTVGKKDLRRLTRTGTDAFEPAWSPDGRTIAYSEGGAIQLIDANGESEPDELTDPDDNDSSPAWNPRPPRADAG